MPKLLVICSQHLGREKTVLVIGTMTEDQAFANFASIDDLLTFGTIIIWKGNTGDSPAVAAGAGGSTITAIAAAVTGITPGAPGLRQIELCPFGDKAC